MTLNGIPPLVQARGRASARACAEVNRPGHGFVPGSTVRQEFSRGGEVSVQTVTQGVGPAAARLALGHAELAEDDIWVSGALVLSFVRACVNLELLFDGEITQAVRSTAPDDWATLAEFRRLLAVCAARYVEPAPILERIGAEMMNVWYSLGPGRSLIHSGLDFLRFQTGSEGYRSVIRGSSDRVGDFVLAELDEERGTAVVHSTTVLPRDMERGVLLGGVRLAGDVAYAEVENSHDPDRFTIRIITSGSRTTLTPPPNYPAEAERPAIDELRWRLYDQERRIAREQRFWNATNHTLARAFASLREKEEALARTNRELERKHQQLERSHAALMRQHQRAEQMFSAYAEVLPGAVLDGKYVVGERIGSGGFGVVFRARQQLLDRDVAIKIFHSAADPFGAETMARFRREGLSTCRVSHPNAITILDSGVSGGGVPYLVMELLEGGTIGELRGDEAPLSIAAVLQLLTPVCEVLAAAHAAGVVHRDIKPDNIFVHSEDGTPVVKVLDFGIAKLLDSAQRGASVQTRTGTLVGTPLYIAPERIRGELYDGRADIYSVGVMAYELVSGVSPFPDGGVNPWEGIMARLNQQPQPLAELAPEVPEELQTIIMQMLEREPSARPDAAMLAATFATLAARYADDGQLRRRVAGLRTRRRDEAGHRPTIHAESGEPRR